MENQRLKKTFWNTLKNKPVQCTFCKKFVWLFNMSSHYSTKHGSVNPEDPKFKKAKAMDSVVNKEKEDFHKATKKRIQDLMKGVKRRKRKKKDEG